MAVVEPRGAQRKFHGFKDRCQRGLRPLGDAARYLKQPGDEKVSLLVKHGGVGCGATNIDSKYDR